MKRIEPIAKKRTIEPGWYVASEIALFIGVALNTFRQNIVPRLPTTAIDKSKIPHRYQGVGVYNFMVDRELKRLGKRGGIKLGNADDDPNSEKRRGQVLENRKKEIELAEMEGDLVPTAALEEGVLKIALLLRRAGETLRRQFGATAHEIVEQALTKIEKQIENGKIFGNEDAHGEQGDAAIASQSGEAVEESAPARDGAVRRSRTHATDRAISES